MQRRRHRRRPDVALAARDDCVILLFARVDVRAHRQCRQSSAFGKNRAFVGVRVRQLNCEDSITAAHRQQRRLMQARLVGDGEQCRRRERQRLAARYHRHTHRRQIQTRLPFDFNNITRRARHILADADCQCADGHIDGVRMFKQRRGDSVCRRDDIRAHGAKAAGPFN